MKGIITTLLLSIFFFTASAQVVGVDIFINEIHYDNTGTDTGEAVEIAGPAGTDVAGLTLTFYNGNGGASYNTLPLTGIIPDEGVGFGTLCFAVTGIQNGSPDGISLDDGSGNIQFLSYEGTFVAVGGPADGMTSTDIGVAEDGSTPIGWSMQLMGLGSVYTDFTWSAPDPDNFCAINTNQYFVSGCNTFDQIVESACVSYTSPSGNHTWTSSGFYVDTVPNIAMCDSVIGIDLTVSPLPTVQAVVTSTSICDGDILSIGGSGADIYNVYVNGLLVAGPFTMSTDITNLVDGDFISLSGADATTGCENTDDFTITVFDNPTAPTISVGGPTEFCDGGSVTLSSSEATGILWTTSETTQDISATVSGSYTVTYTDANGCSATSSPTDVIVNPNPTTPIITSSGSTNICDGESVTLSASEATGILWSSAETTQDISVSATGSFTVTYTDANGCSAVSAATDVTVNPLPTITANATATTVCEGDAVTLSGAGGVSYTWDNGVTDGTAFNASVTATYTVIGTDANGCENTDNVTVTVNPLPTVSMTALAQVCVYNAAFDLTNGSPAGGTYSGTGVSSGQFDPATAGVGTHTITYAYTDGNSCTNTATADITVDACSSLEEIEELFLNVYPNPSNGFVQVKTNLTGTLKIQIVDLTGKVLIETNETQLNLSGLSTGKYIVQISNDHSILRTSVVKK